MSRRTERRREKMVGRESRVEAEINKEMTVEGDILNTGVNTPPTHTHADAHTHTCPLSPFML